MQPSEIVQPVASTTVVNLQKTDSVKIATVIVLVVGAFKEPMMVVGAAVDVEDGEVGVDEMIGIHGVIKSRFYDRFLLQKTNTKAYLVNTRNKLTNHGVCLLVALNTMMRKLARP